MRLSSKIGLFCLAYGSILCSQALAQTNLNPTADTYVRAGIHASSNFGTASLLQLKTNASLDYNRDVYFKFDLSSVASVASAKLRVYANLSGTGSVGTSVYSVADTSWSESGMTWNNKPARGSTALASATVNSTAYTWYELDVTSYVSSEKGAGRNVISLALHNPSNSDPNININSREAAANKPVLVVTTSSNPAPTVNITSPASGTTYTAPATVPINATASDSNGTISKVDFFAGSTVLATDTTSPYSVNWSSVAQGSYSLTAKATDNANAATTSSAVNITVNASSSASNNAAPSVWVSNPFASWTITGIFPAVRLDAAATDSDGTISKVEFFSGTTLLSTQMSSPHSMTWNSVAAGTYSLNARATDNGGATKTSGNVSVKVEDNTTRLDASSFLGGAGTADGVRGTEIQSNGTIVLAANISSATPGGLTPVLLNGATSSSSGAVIRLSADGRTVLSVTRVSDEVWDVSLDGGDNIYVAARAGGLLKLNSTASSLTWKGDTGGSTDRVDAAPNGYAAALKGAYDSGGWTASGAGTLYVFDNNGTQLGSFAGHNRTQDVCIDSVSQSVISIGWQNKNSCHNPVQVAYIRSHNYSGTQKWKAYDWSGNAVDSDCGEGCGVNNMADTRGYRIEIGDDGYLYFGAECAGGNHIFRYSPFDLCTAVAQAGGDQWHQFYNTKSEHKLYFGKMNASNGSFVTGNQLCARYYKGEGNACRLYQGDIKADKDGRVYLGVSAAQSLPYSFNPVSNLSTYHGGPSVLIMASDLKTRLFCGRVAPGGGMHAVAGRVLAGKTAPNFVFGGSVPGTDPLWRKNAIQNSPGSGTEGFFAAKPEIVLP